MYAAAMEQMIGQQVRTWEVLDELVLAAMRSVPRELFVPAAWRSLAYADTALPLPLGKHMLTPMLAGRILQAVAPRAGSQLLEIGTGSGYLSACCAALGATVQSLELHPQLADTARSNLQAAGVAGVEVTTADGLQITAAERYDCVVLTASLPIWQPQFQRALRVGGRLFAVVGEGAAMEARLVERLASGEYQSRVLFETTLEALDNAPRTPVFRF
jgi:protein-L-isoaspartate(D-aspartate) O-methyltransferase